MNDFIVANSGLEQKEREFQTRPKHKIASRGNDVDPEKVKNNVSTNQFYVIHVAARMTRKITKERRREEIDPYVTPVDALKEMETKKVKVEDYLLTVPNDKWASDYYANKLNDGWTWFR